ncbi:pentapeptide repeat-containing protein [Streptomyces sp. ADI95-17]|uniref:pentapeptide repeat-containing protein n=1 Tax=unclassified Streptomyces TaxID=2593676 RepID=UPI000F5C0556|nr:pentapeptide repeat-containing protein [Streptomyces sp. ADI95-17]RPK58543.1 Secreted effector protein pipB2 [Streptomyces sp. ADI95-17]
MKASIKRSIALSSALLGVALFVLLFWKAPWWLDGTHIRSRDLQPADGVIVTGIRTGLVALGAAIVAGVGLYYTDRNFRHTRERDRETAEISREGQITERYTEAIKLLSSVTMTERLGGIYSLERIMHDSEKDHWPVVEVLASFIREHASVSGEIGREFILDTPNETPPQHIQAALSVLARRPKRDEQFNVNLSYTDLRGAHLQGGDCAGFQFRHCRLDGAHLEGANLKKAFFWGANLNNAYLIGIDGRHVGLVHCNLENAKLTDSDLSNSFLHNSKAKSASFRGCDLTGANLYDTALQGADLRDAALDCRPSLTEKQTKEANL